MSNVEGYLEYCGGCRVTWRAIMSNMEGAE